MTVQDIQQALKDARFDPGPIDGIRGRKTIAAIKMFQRENALEVDGIVGPRTAAVLFKNGAPKPERFEVPSTMPWLEEAAHLLGVREQVGPGSNIQILDWAKTLGIGYRDDAVAWCGLFVAHCIGSQLPEETLPTHPLGAREWSSFGTAVRPCVGAVMVFWRESRASGLGHVGFYWAEDDVNDRYLILGGNQSDAVSFAWKPKERFIEARWPGTAPAPTIGTRIADSDGQLLSQHEA